MTTALTAADLTTSAATLLADWHDWLTLQVAAGELAPTSAATYRVGMSRFATWLAGNGGAGDAASVLQWKAALQAAHKPCTINTWLAGVRAFYTWAVSVGRMTANPTANCKGAKRTGTATSHKRDALTEAEVVRVLALANPTTPAGARDAAIVALMAYTAGRSIEIHRADLQDLQTDSGRLVLRVQGKGRVEKDERIVIAPQAEAAMRDWLAYRGTAPGPLFTAQGNRSKGRLSLRAIRAIVKRLYARGGVVGNKTTHSLRHAAITSAIKHGAPVQKVQAMARHANIATTMIYYHEHDRITNPAEDFVSYEAR